MYRDSCGKKKKRKKHMLPDSLAFQLLSPETYVHIRVICMRNSVVIETDLMRKSLQKMFTPKYLICLPSVSVHRQLQRDYSTALMVIFHWLKPLAFTHKIFIFNQNFNNSNLKSKQYSRLNFKKNHTIVVTRGGVQVISFLRCYF